MKILAVRFQNLNSLKGEHEIRFDQSPLAEAGLFAITGPTGAGKTTILDAITVGLYGMAHRHSTDRPLELMTRHTAECFSEVEFEADNKKYRSKWHLRRSRGKAEGNIQPVHMELYSFGEDCLLDLKPSEVPVKVADLCGLDYNQFLRSVVLSQGDFARFLKAKPSERSTLLEKITDTGIYSQISKYAFEKAKSEKQNLEGLENQLQNTQLLPEEQRTAYQQSIIEFTANEAILEKDIQSIEEQVQWLQQIKQLITRKQESQQVLAEQEQKLEKLKPDFIKLQQHENANQFVGELAEIRSADSKVFEAQEELEELQKKVPTLEVELESAGKLALDASAIYQQKEKAFQQLEPILTQVNKLDHQLQTFRDSYTKNKASYIAFEELLKQDNSQLLDKKEKLGKLTQEATALKKWLEQNAKLQDLKEHLPEFKVTLRDLQDTESRITAIEKERDELTKKRQDETYKQQVLEQEEEKILKTQKDQQVIQQNKVSGLQEILSDKKLEDLENELQLQPALVARYERMLELAKQYQNQQQKLANSKQHQTAQEEKLIQLRTTLTEAREKHQQAEGHLNALEKLVTLQQQILQFEEARHNLTENEPCPLCGSKHHPFAEEAYGLNLPEEIQKRDKQKLTVKELEQLVNTLEVESRSLEQQIAISADNIKELTTEVERLLKTFEHERSGLSISIAISDVDQLALIIQEHHEKASKLQKQLAAARELSREIEAGNKKIQQLREEQIEVKSKRDQIVHSSKLIAEQLQKLEVVLTDSKSQKKVHTETAQSFALSFGHNFEYENRLQLLHTLEQLALSFVAKQQVLEGMREDYSTTKEQVANLTERVKDRNTELQSRKDALKAEHEQLTQLKSERQTLFGDKDPEQERQTAQRELKASATHAEESRSQQIKKQQELQEAKARYTACQTKHQQNKSVLEELRKGLLAVLKQKGIATIEALSQMLLERDEADRLANLKKHIEKQLTESKKLFSDIDQQLNSLKKKVLTSEEASDLVQKQQVKKEQLREIISQKARQQQLLEQDAQQREKNRELAAKLATQKLVYHRWSQLSDLIGSSEGTKFSKFAQGLTLARLVELANKHLYKLNDRYRILKSENEDLDLLIIDTYQAEAIRPMNTLSGGESFLVSLALALGLSDLAGRRTQINSLFIDEGFGTLDAETLDSAISTLENLQASGKMIGIISHVEALKERIHTQIKVQRQIGGISKVQVEQS